MKWWEVVLGTLFWGGIIASVVWVWPQIESTATPEVQWIVVDDASLKPVDSSTWTVPNSFDTYDACRIHAAAFATANKPPAHCEPTKPFSDTRAFPGLATGWFLLDHGYPPPLYTMSWGPFSTYGECRNALGDRLRVLQEDAKNLDCVAATLTMPQFVHRDPYAVR